MYVRNTENLLGKIKDSIHQLYENRIAHAQKFDTYGYTLKEINELILGAVLPPDIQDMLDKMGQMGFISALRSTKVIILLKDLAPNANLSPNDYVQHVVSLETERFLPPKWDSYLIEDRPKLYHEVLADVFKQRIDKTLALTTEREQTCNKIAQIYSAVSSINELVKLVPFVEEFLPHDVRSKLAAKTERKPKAVRAKEKLEDKGIDIALVESLKVDVFKAKVAA